MFHEYSKAGVWVLINLLLSSNHQDSGNIFQNGNCLHLWKCQESCNWGIWLIKKICHYWREWQRFMSLLMCRGIKIPNRTFLALDRLFSPAAYLIWKMYNHNNMNTVIRVLHTLINKTHSISGKSFSNSWISNIKQYRIGNEYMYIDNTQVHAPKLKQIDWLRQ